jgi:hypothetical protein
LPTETTAASSALVRVAVEAAEVAASVDVAVAAAAAGR